MGKFDGYIKIAFCQGIITSNRLSVKTLFSLLRCSLWGNTYTEHISATEFKRVIALAKEQTVFGLVFDKLKEIQVDGLDDKSSLYEALGYSERIKPQNKLIDNELASFSDVCRQEGHDFIVVKGQTVGCLYNNPNLRQSGDIDFLINAEYGSIKDTISRLMNVTLPDKMQEYEVGFDHHNVRYELHTVLKEFATKSHKNAFEELTKKEWEDKHYVEIAGSKVRTLSPTMNAAYIFIHLFFHFIKEGVSLRQFCDWAIVLHHYNAEIDKDKLIRILLELDMFDAYCAFGTILVDELGLPKKEFPVSLDDNDREWKGKILDDIFRGGNFGKLNHNTHSAWKFKLETLRIVLRNIFRYYTLCPSEIGGMIPRLVGVNLKLLLAK